MHLPDHIIYFVPDLAEATDYFESTWGVRPKFGGQHPGRGSHNALLSLGDSTYLEIIAPDPTQPTPPQPRSFGMDRLSKAKLVTWAVTSTDINQSIQNATGAGYDPGPAYDGARARSDGSMMNWKLTRRDEAITGDNPPGNWLIPFLIDWGNTPHPAKNNPTGCTLVSVRATHPEPEPVRHMLATLGVDCPVEKGDSVQLIATVDTPKGLLELK